MPHRPILIPLQLLLVTVNNLISCQTCLGLESKTIHLFEPYAEWHLSYSGAQGQARFDVEASATFTHSSGDRLTSQMFFTGTDDVYAFRFTGTKPGKWTIMTSGPGSLNKQTGTVEVVDNSIRRNGFIASKQMPSRQGTMWIHGATARPFVPQVVYGTSPMYFWKDAQVDSTAVKRHVHEIVQGHGFSGMHLEGRAYLWRLGDEKSFPRLDAANNGPATFLREQDRYPDVRTFQIYEQLILETYKAGGATYLQLWAHESANPDSVGGPMGVADKRMNRYIAARLGPLPGWFIGYGYDMDRWATRDELDEWKAYLQSQLGGWPHLIGGRAHGMRWPYRAKDGHPDSDTHPENAYWHGDFGSYCNLRPAYKRYVQAMLVEAHKPSTQDDRFRIRDYPQFTFKDYIEPPMIVRGLWHSTMAGGVGNIWGNLTDVRADGQYRGYFDSGEIFGKAVGIKQQTKTYSRFWFESDRFRSDFLRDNRLTGNMIGEEYLYPDARNPISVCLRSKNATHFVFYSEDTSSIKMDLRMMKHPLAAIAVDVRREYQEVDLGELQPEEQSWQPPRSSDWAIAVGEF